MNEITVDQVVLFNATASAEYEISTLTASASQGWKKNLL